MGAKGNADLQGTGNVGAPATVPMLDAAEGVAPEKQCPHGLIIGTGRRRMTANAM